MFDNLIYIYIAKLHLKIFICDSLILRITFLHKKIEFYQSRISKFRFRN